MPEYQPKFWFNVVTKQVEEDMNHSRKQDLLGPYPTRAAAASALNSTAEQTEKWDAEDERRAREEAEFRGEDPDDPENSGWRSQLT